MQLVEHQVCILPNEAGGATSTSVHASKDKRGLSVMQ